MARPIAGTLVSLGIFCAAVAARAEAPVYVLDLKGAVGVGSGDYIERGLGQARTAGGGLVVLRMDTPGGLVSSTRKIIQAILASPIPVATFVAPSGAQAASAGTYILYASHVAAMAPGTNVGAATPVEIGGLPAPPEQPTNSRRKRPAEGTEETAPPDTPMERKIVNDAAAWLRSLAELRGRNAEWAERAVRQAASITAAEALKENVIDLVAADLGDLLAQLDQRTVKVGGKEQALRTAGAPISVLAPDWRAQLLTTLTDPNVALILMLIGVYGIMFEFLNPGFVLPGVMGGVSLLLALAAFAVLPIDYAGLALLLLGIALMIGEAFSSGIVLGVGGLCAFALGAIFLFDQPPGVDLSLSWPVIASTSLSSAMFLILVVGMSLRARRRAVVSGREEMIGSRAKVLDWSGQEGRVYVHGEVWQARASQPLAPNQEVRIVALQDLTLIVEPARRGDDHA
jgi:membrane-bound serine protease (ClpP class)